jgi:Xaa-Pro aminopeptidase
MFKTTLSMRLRHFVTLSIGLLLGAAVVAQEDLPQDYLSAGFHAGRRDSLRQLMPANSVFIVWAAPTRNFANDVDYVFHQKPDMFYFTGYKEPHSMLLVFKEPQTAADGSTFKELLYVQKRNAQAEQWTGKRLGVEGAKQKLGFTHVYNGEDFKNITVDFAKFDKVIFDYLPTDLGESRDSANLSNLVKILKAKAQVPANYTQDKHFGPGLYTQYTAQLREIKTAEELNLLRKAVEISCQGQVEVMKAVRPDMSEREVQGIHEFVHKKYGAENVGYPSIVGAGNNGCVLHYEENDKLHVENKMVLMDVGAEYHGYTADVTRTVPVNGKFTPEQKAIYELVYNAQEAAFKLCKEGSTWQELDKVSREIIEEGLIKLGIITKKEEARKYYPHGLSHHIGLDVHDRGSYQKIKKGMVITIEPGIYIPENSNCDKKWWGIAVRIEDDLHIREKDYELLSAAAPRKIADIEKMVAEKSIFDNYNLPKLKSDKKGF